MAQDKPKFSAGLVTAIITLFWLAVFVGVVIIGMDGVAQQASMLNH